MGLSTLPPLKAVRVPSILMQQHRKRKHRTSKHHYLLRMKRDESLRLRRLGSGLLEQDVLDSSILTHLVVWLGQRRWTLTLLASNVVNRLPLFPDKPYGFCGRKEPLKKASAFRAKELCV